MKRLCFLFLTVLTSVCLSFALSAEQQGTFKEGCGAADPAYIRMANETGGIPMFLQRSEAAKSFQLVR
jgi:hypothetical protein